MSVIDGIKRIADLQREVIAPYWHKELNKLRKADEGQVFADVSTDLFAENGNEVINILSTGDVLELYKLH